MLGSQDGIRSGDSGLWEIMSLLFSALGSPPPQHCVLFWVLQLKTDQGWGAEHLTQPCALREGPEQAGLRRGGIGKQGRYMQSSLGMEGTRTISWSNPWLPFAQANTTCTPNSTIRSVLGGSVFHSPASHPPRSGSKVSSWPGGPAGAGSAETETQSGSGHAVVSWALPSCMPGVHVAVL